MTTYEKIRSANVDEMAEIIVAMMIYAGVKTVSQNMSHEEVVEAYQEIIKLPKYATIREEFKEALMVDFTEDGHESR